MDVHAEKGGCVVALLDVPRDQTHRYGICDGFMATDRLMQINAMVEKPKPEDAPSTYSIVGRYILPPDIHDILRNTPRGAGGEIQLTDALAVLAKRGEAWGLEFEGKRFDTGNVLGLFDATLHFIHKRPDLAERARELIQKYSD